MKREARSASYLLRLKPSEKRDLEAAAKRRGITLADALREGARTLLNSGRGV